MPRAGERESELRCRVPYVTGLSCRKRWCRLLAVDCDESTLAAGLR